MFIDFGQISFGKTTQCRNCGMVMVIGDTEVDLCEIILLNYNTNIIF